MIYQKEENSTTNFILLRRKLLDAEKVSVFAVSIIAGRD